MFVSMSWVYACLCTLFWMLDHKTCHSFAHWFSAEKLLASVEIPVSLADAQETGWRCLFTALNTNAHKESNITDSKTAAQENTKMPHVIMDSIPDHQPPQKPCGLWICLHPFNRVCTFIWVKKVWNAVGVAQAVYNTVLFWEPLMLLFNLEIDPLNVSLDESQVKTMRFCEATSSRL